MSFGSNVTTPHAHAVVDLQAVAHNTALFAAHTEAAVMAVVKADGFGHGALQVSTAALAAGATWLGERPAPRRRACVTSRDSTLALVPLGYADGVPWAAARRAQVWIAGRRYPVAGGILRRRDRRRDLCLLVHSCAAFCWDSPAHR